MYEPENNKFDHHQRGFDEIFGHGFVTKLSSAGLVYKHFGREIVANTLGLSSSDPIVEKIYLKVYKSFVEGVDGIDNGVDMYDTDAPAKYSENTNLSARVGKLNPPWDELSRVLQTLRESGAAAYLVVPEWPSQPWWPDLLELTTDSFLVAPARDNFLPGHLGSVEAMGSPFWYTRVCKIG